MNVKQMVKNAVMGLAVLVIAGYGAYRLVQISTVQAAATSCIITVFGQQYDVTSLQNAHTGGNIFTCGTDMTATFQTQHGTDVLRIAPYLISTPSPTATPTPSPTPVSSATPLLTPTPTPTGAISPTPTPLPGTRYIDDDDDQDDHENELVEEREKDHTETHRTENNDHKSSDARHEDED